MVCHLFITFGALSVHAATQLSRELEATLAADPTSCIWVLSTVLVPEGAFSPGVHLRVMSPTAASLDEWKKPLALARFLDSALREMDAQGVSDIRLYTPHVFEVLGNYFAYFDARVKAISMLPDGLVNYAPRPLIPEGARKKLGYLARVSLRRLAMARFGRNYRVLTSGDLTQFNRLPWEATWTFQPHGLLTAGGTVRKLSLVSDGQNREHNFGTLVLDQELDEIADARLQKRMREAMVNYVGTAPQKIYYKQHPRGQNRFSSFEKAGPTEEVTGVELAEQSCLRLGVAKVVGFYSTALLLVGDTKIERVAFVPAEAATGIRRRQFVKDLKSALEASGATVVEVR